jgi:glycine dehydrogenase subunit 2
MPTVYEISVAGRAGFELPALDVRRSPLPDGLTRADNGLPELSELDVIRHYLRLSQRNYGVDSGFYPLGSCTMKYNPKICEEIARLPGFADTHPFAPTERVQGNLALMHHLQTWLAEIGGFAGVSLQPAAGAHGELTALLMIRAYHADRGQHGRDQILIPDSAHGTNPASTTMAGFIAVEIPSDERGNIDIGALRVACTERVAGLMITNPNTLGLFEEHIEEVIRLVHGCGGLVYGDGANMNALTGILRPGDLGIDLMHYNLHKTFATPHGGGGPGSGPVGAARHLVDYLPGPIVARIQPSNGSGTDAQFAFEMPPRTIGRVASTTATSACWCGPMRICGCSALRACVTAPCMRC